MADYIIVSNTGAIGGGKRVRILLAPRNEGSGLDLPRRLTLTNKLLTPVDTDLMDVSFSCLVRETESDALYFSLADLRAIRFPATAALRKLKVQDHDGVIRDMFWMNRWNPIPAMGQILTGTDGWYSVTIQFAKYQ